MEKDHSDSERRTWCHHYIGYFILISSKGSFIFTIPQTFTTPVVEHWLEWEIAQWVHHEGSIQRPTAPRAATLAQSYILLLYSLTDTLYLSQVLVSQ